MKNKGLGIVFMLIGILLIAGSAGLAGYNMIEDEQAGEEAVDMLKAYAVTVEDNKEKLDKLVDKSNTNEVSEQYIPDYILNPEMEMPIVEVDGVNCVGRVVIPEIEIDLPIVSEWSYSGLKKAPCRYYGSVYQDNMVIAAHNYTRHFGKLKNLSQGSIVTVIDSDGNEFEYRVAYMDEIGPYQTEKVKDTGYDLVMFTCTLGGRTRVAVYCNRVIEEVIQ